MQIHETYSLHQSNIACRYSLCIIIALQCNYVSIFHVMARFGLQRLMLQTTQTMNKVR